MAGDGDIDEIYDEAGFGYDLGFGDSPAVLVIDLQKGLTDPDRELTGGADISGALEAADRVVDAAHEGGVPVVFVRVVYRQHEAADAGIYLERHPTLASLRAGTEAVEIDDRLDVREDDFVLDKRGPSAFHDTELDSMFRHMGVDTVVVTGCNTSGCVRATVVDACQKSYYVVVAEEAVGDRHEAPHEANLFDIDMKYADVLSTAEVADHLASE